MRRKTKIGLSPYLDDLTAAIEARESEFRVEITPVSSDTEPEAYYWHLYHFGQRINGGLIEDTRRIAEVRAHVYRTTYTRDLILATHIWNGKRLIPRM